MIAGLQQRCWNHEGREAVCRCPGCGRSFCRECVSEHEARLLCAACLSRAAQTAPRRPNPLRRLAPAAMLLAGMLIAWIVLFGAGESLIILSQRAEQNAWQNR
jgi:hypothetical protein